MPSSNSGLAEIQAWMQSVIMHPAGVIDGIASDEARSHLNICAAEIETVIQHSARQTSIERLQIYSGAYYARLLECLRAEYPIMTEAMGAELFDEFAVQYLQCYPSHNYTLNELGAGFATFLAETRPTSATEDNSWLDFLVDLAKLEWCFAEVFDGPGAERQPLLEWHSLQAISAESWHAARLMPVPCLQILNLDFPVQHYYRAIRDGDNALPPDRESTWLAIWRRNYVVRQYDLTYPEVEILGAILAGATVGEAIGHCTPPADLEQFAADLRRWFQEWTAQGFFLGVATSDS